MNAFKSELIKVTKKEWGAIPTDYKLCEKGQPRKVLLGCIQKGAGAVLVTEGMHFEIV